MSTRSDVEIWTRTLRAAHPELALVGRNLVLTPVQNFIHGIFIDRTSSKDVSRAICYLTPLIEFGGSNVHFALGHHLPIPFSNQPHFRNVLTEVCDLAIREQLAGVESVPDLLRELSSNTWFFDSSNITGHPLRHAVLLAADGNLAAAEGMLAAGLESERRTAAVDLAHAEREFAKRSNSGSGRVYLEQATVGRELIASLEPLLDMIRAADRAGIGAFLRERERQSVKEWGVEHLWEPMPFPVEQV